MADNGTAPEHEPLLRGGSVVDDTFTLVESGALPAGDVVVPLARFIEEETALKAHGARLGVLLQPTDDVRALAGKLEGVALVVLHWPKQAEGRGYTHARILREQLGFRGHVRAQGALIKDHLWFLSRCGVDEVRLAPGHDLLAAAAALKTFSVTYQPAADGLANANAQRRRM
jgi:uncharacterized protein (DUF934 family)